MGTGKSLAAIETMERSGSDDWWYVGPRSAIKAVELELRKWKSKVQPKMITYEGLTKIVKSDSYDVPAGIWFDESSRIKSPTAQRSQAAAILSDDVREKDGYLILTSGTPAPKSPVDWFHQCRISCPGFLKEGTYHKFRSALAIISQQEGPYGQAYPKIVSWLDNEKKCAVCGELESNHSFIQGIEHAFKPSVNECERLYKRMSGLVLVQFKKDCLDLPEKIYRRIELTPSKQTLEIAKALVKSAPTVIKGLILLRELSDGFQYVEKASGEKPCSVCIGSGEIISPINNEEKIICDGCGGIGKTTIYSRTTEQVETPKDEALRDLLDEYSEIGRVVIYAGFTGSVDRCVQICQDMKWNYIRVDGRGWHSDLDNNEHLINFQEKTDQYPRVAFIGQPGAAGMGLTLTASPVIIYYSNDFNAESRVQSEDRIHRPGTRGCTIIDLLHLDTDYLVLDNLQKKRELQAITMGDINQVLDGKRHNGN
jgi:SNF2 family DNA or RNA helicase